MKQFFPALAILILASPNLRAAASDIGGYNVSKIFYYNQSSVAAPPINKLAVAAQIFSTSPTGILNPTLQTPLSGPISLSFSTSIANPNGVWSWKSAFFSTQAALDAAYPDGNYQFSIPTASGTALTYTPTLTQTGNYPGTAPVITNTTWSGPLLTLNYNVASTITWNNPGVVTQIELVISGSSGDTLVFNYNGGGVGSQVIAANTLSPNESYGAELIFNNFTSDTTQIPGVTGLSYNSTANFFGIVPEPSTCAMLVGGLGLLGLAVRRKCVKA
jgi:PEP-CTERM motif